MQHFLSRLKSPPPRNGFGRLLALLVVVFGVYFVSPLATQAAITPGSSDNFITTWDTTKTGLGSTPNNQIRIKGIGGGFNYDIYWENVASSTMNGTTTTTSNNFILTLPTPGIYRVEIADDFPRLYFLDNTDRLKILEVNNWGNIEWSSMNGAFYGTENLRIPATDAPDLSNVTDMSYMFKNASAFNDPINHWDVSNVIYMSWMFNNATNFNQPLNDWNVSNVTSMYSMFQDAISFNQPLNNWNTSKVVQMQNLFNYTIAFNQPLDNWDISSSTNMVGMLGGTRLSTVNQDATLTSWSTQASSKSLTGRQLNIGLKSYSGVGASAIATLQGLGWTVLIQHSATYNVSAPATLTGNAFQVRNSGQSTAPVTVNFPPSCSFLEWSDGNASTTRSDVLTDNLEVTALVDCDPVSPGTFTIKQVIADEIALSIGSSLVLSPSIPGVTGGVSSGELPFNVKTNNALGYQVSLSFAQVVPFRHLLSPSSYIFNYAPQVVGVPDYEMIVPNRSHSFAYSVFSDNAAQKFRHSGSTCGVGSDNTFGKCWYNQANARTPVTIVERNSPTSSDGATSTLQFKVVVDENPVPVLPSGEYGATVTVTVLPL